MSSATVKKSRIDLGDYDHSMDLCCRLFVNNLSILQRELLEEIVCGPLQFSMHEMENAFAMEKQDFTSFFKKLIHCGLVRVDGDFAMVDKEKRKLVELALEPFDSHFKPDFHYIKAQIKKVPIHIIPVWYSLPKNCNSLFLSIIEKYLHSPQIYERYLQELHFAHPILDAIHQKLYASKSLKLSVSELKEEFQLDDEAMEKCLIQLEFNLSGCAYFEQVEGSLERAIAPFYEYSQYRRYLEEKRPNNIASKDVQLLRESASFLDDLKKIATMNLADESTVLSTLKCSQKYYQYLVDSLKRLGFSENQEAFSNFIKMPQEEQAMAVLRFSHSIEPIYKDTKSQEKAFKEIQKSIILLAPFDFVLWEDFLQLLAVPMDTQEGVTLQKQGVRYKYQFPVYSDQEIDYIQKVIYYPLFQAGVVQIGFFQNELCISLTSFGKSIFGAI